MVALFNPSERAHAHYRHLLHEQGRSLQPVSYTHLTLPTILRV